MAYTLPKLAYDYNALEPHIDARTMEIHHTKHHQAYITNLNNALEAEKVTAPANPVDLIKELSTVPEKIRMVVRNNGGGHVNHAFFWTLLSKTGGGEPTGELKTAIEKTFGTLDEFKKLFAAAATSRFGSGWAWLCVKPDKSVFICSTPNQDNPQMKGVVETTGIPVLGLDVWEHAYYLNYQNRRTDYITAFWSIVDWKQANEYYKKAIES